MALSNHSMKDIYLPTLLFWENLNTWYGSQGGMRFYISPDPGEDGASSLKAEIWRGPKTKEFCEILETASFPLSEEGLGELKTWLGRKAEETASREEKGSG